MNTNQLYVIGYRLLCLIWRWRYLFVVPSVLLAVAMGFYASTSQTYFMSRTSLLLQESALANPFLKDMSVAVKLKERIRGLDALLHSRFVMAEVALDNGLVTENSSDWQREAVQRQLANATTMRLIGDSMVHIELTWDDPRLAQQLLISISDSFQKRLMAPAQAAVEQSETFLAAQLERQQQSVLAVEAQLAQFKQENAELLPNLIGANNMALLEAQQQIRVKTMDLQGAKARFSNLKQQLLLANPVVSEIERQIVQAQAELTLLKSRYTDKHSKVKSTQARLNQLQKEKGRLLSQARELKQKDEAAHIDDLWQLATEFQGTDSGQVPNLLSSQLQQLQQASSLIATLEGELKVLNDHQQSILSRMSESAEVEQKLSELQRLVDGRKVLYQELLVRFEKAQVTEQLGRFEAPQKIQVIDRPNLPKSSINRPWWLSALLGFFGGIGLGVMAVSISFILDRRVHSAEQLRQLLPQHLVIELKER